MKRANGITFCTASPFTIASDIRFGEGGARYRLTDKGPLPPVFVEINPRVAGVFKECDFGECTGREIHPKALTLPVDTHGRTSLRHPRKVRARKGWND